MPKRLKQVHQQRGYMNRNKHIKRFSTSLAIRKIHIKTMMSCNYTFIRMAKIKNTAGAWVAQSFSNTLLVSAQVMTSVSWDWAWCQALLSAGSLLGIFSLPGSLCPSLPLLSLSISLSFSVKWIKKSLKKSESLIVSYKTNISTIQSRHHAPWYLPKKSWKHFHAKACTQEF